MRLKLKDRKKDDELLNIIEKDVYSQDEMDYMYAIVREYLYDHQGENAIQVAENTRHLLHPCKICGAMIEYGDICHECKVSKMTKILHPDSPSPKKKMSGYDAGKVKQKQEIGYGRRIRKNQ